MKVMYVRLSLTHRLICVYWVKAQLRGNFPTLELTAFVNMKSLRQTE